VLMEVYTFDNCGSSFGPSSIPIASRKLGGTHIGCSFAAEVTDQLASRILKRPCGQRENPPSIYLGLGTGD
jgi:hypothetical protein